jgi:D-alanyl-D-alanine carboxypeptidase
MKVTTMEPNCRQRQCPSAGKPAGPKARGPAARLKCFSGLLALWLSGLPATSASLEATLPTITARGAIVIDRDTGWVLGAKAPDTQIPPASTTKIMTALLACERIRLPADNSDYRNIRGTVAISANAAGEGGSRAGFVAGDRISLLELLYCMLLPSGNDAALAVAEHFAGTEAAFVVLMNARADELGLADTNFETAHGRNAAGQVTSARDLARLAWVAMQDPLFARIVGTATYTTTTWTDSSGTPRLNWTDPTDGAAMTTTLANSNRLLTDPNLVYPGANGVKTGTTTVTNLVAAAGRPGKALIAVVLDADPTPGRYNDARLLLDWGFTNLFWRVHPTSMAWGFFNDDAYEDLAVGVPYECVNGISAAGKVLVYMGSAGGLDTDNPMEFTQNSAGIGGGAEPGDYFGFALVAGDFDGNGRDDLAIGVPFEDLGSLVDAGAVHVIYSDDNGLNPTWAAHPSQLFAQDDQGFGDLPGGAEAGDLFGYSLAVGNFDDTWGDDLAIGVPGEDITSPSATDGGAVNVIYGGGLAVGLRADLHPQVFDQSNPAEVPGTAESGDEFGFSLAAGDFDGNGYDDLAIGAPFENVNGDDAAGHVSIIYARAGGLDAAFKVGELHQDSPSMPGATDPEDYFGFSLATGDFDNNGRADLAIGVPGQDFLTIPDVGYVNVVYGDATGLNPALATHPAQEIHQGRTGIPDSNEAGDRFGAALATGDFDNSRPNYVRDDLAIGLPGEDLITGGTTRTNAGAVVVLYASGLSGLTNNPAPDFLTLSNAVGVTMLAGPGEEVGTVLGAGRFDAGSTEDLAWGVWGQRYDGTNFHDGFALVIYSAGLSGLDTNTTEALDRWFGTCCDPEPLPLRLSLGNFPVGPLSLDLDDIWNVARGLDVRWNFEGIDYTVGLPNDGYANGFNLSLNRALCSDHFKFHYTDSDATHRVTRAYVEQMAALLEEGWRALFDTEGYRNPRDLMLEGRYATFERFERVPVLILAVPDGANHGKTTPAIYLKTDLTSTSQSPIHELFHVMHYGYTYYRASWFLEGVARWSQRFKSSVDACCVCAGYGGFMPLTFSLTASTATSDHGYCDVAPFLNYLALKYKSAGDPDGSGVIKAMLEEMADLPADDADIPGDENERAAMLAIERACDRIGPGARTGRYGDAFAEWASANYVDDLPFVDALRPGAPLRPRFKPGGLQAPGGNEYLWRQYAFTNPHTTTITIQIRASARALAGGGDDDLRVLLDDTVVADWNTANAFNGSDLQGAIKTAHIVVPDLPAGGHVIKLEADARPTLYELAVFSGEVRRIFQASPNSRPAVFQDSATYLSYNLPVPAGVSDLTIQLSGSAQSSKQNVAGGDPDDADDAWLLLDGVTLESFRTEGALDGRYQDGDLATVEVVTSGLAPGNHTLIVKVDGRPTISDLVVFATPPGPPLLHVRHHKLTPWSASYHVVPVTQALIDSDDSLLIEFHSLEWSADLVPPFNELMRIRAAGTLSGIRDRRDDEFSTARTVYHAALQALGDGGRLVHLGAASGYSGFYEVVVRPVPDANDAPVIAAIADQNIAEGAELRFNVSATDPDIPANTFTYRFHPGAPAGASIGLNTGLFTWTPGEAQGPGNYFITVLVTDDGFPPRTSAESFIVTVTEANAPPLVQGIAPREVIEQMPLDFVITATDPDLPANTLTFSLEPGAPEGAGIDPATGRFLWAPDEQQGPGFYEVAVRVSDNGAPPMQHTRSFTVQVREANVRPALAAIGNQNVVEGTTLSFMTSASDSDFPANTLRFSLDTGTPAGAAIDPVSGLFTWTPTESQGPGNYRITVRVTDSGVPNLADTRSFTVVVSEDNRAPVLAAIADQQVVEGSALRFSISATDADLPADALTYALEPGAPVGAVIDPVSGLFSWTPTEAQGPGAFDIIVRVTDDGVGNLSATLSFRVAVAEQNSAPVMTAIADRTIHAGMTLEIAGSASDADLPANMLSFSLKNGPTGASIDSVSGLLTWNPPAGQPPGASLVTVAVTDDGLLPLSDEEAFIITVVPPPSLSPALVVENNRVRLTWSAIPGQRYGAQWKSRVDDSDWTDYPETIVAESDTATFEDALSSTQRFYRMIALP